MPLTIPPCPPAHIAIVADDGDGAFTGMSHAGTYVFLRNTGARPCRLPALPPVRLFDRRGRPLPATRNPAPVAPSITVAPGARAQLSLRWVAGPVYDRSRCLTAARIAVADAGVRVAARLCGRVGSPVRFDQTALTPIADYPAE